MAEEEDGGGRFVMELPSDSHMMSFVGGRAEDIPAARDLLGHFFGNYILLFEYYIIV